MKDHSWWYTAQQPQFFPPLYIIARHANVHVSVVLEEAQWSRHGYHSRCLLQSANGPVWVSIPIQGGTTIHKKINEMIPVEDWFEDVFAPKIRGIYQSAPFYRQVTSNMMGAGMRMARSRFLSEVNFWCLDWIRRYLNLDFSIVRSTDIVPHRPINACEWMASFGPELDATDYIQGENSMRSYFVPGVFRDRGIRLWAQRFPIPFYSHLLDSDNPEISVLDTLMIVDPERTRKMVLSNDRTTYAVRMKEFE